MNKLNHGPLLEEAGEGSSGGGSHLGTGAVADADAGQSGGEITIPDNFMEVLPEDLRSDPSLKDYKPGKEGLEAIVKTMIHGQKMMGKERIAVPTDSSTPDEIQAFRTSIGVPNDPEGYEIQVPETLKNLTPDAEGLKKWTGIMHEEGVPKGAAQKLIARYYEETDEQIGEINSKNEAQSTEALNKLRDNWGDKFDQKAAIAAGVVRKFGGEEVQKYMDESGLGDNPSLIALFHNIGAAMLDDNAAGGGQDLLVTDSTRAKQEIESLKGDKDFIAQLTNRTSVGFKAAKERWDDLHKVAFT